MNIELNPIAESKVRQLGGDVCGVLVRDDSGVMAVSEHGRCTRLDVAVMGPVEPAGMSERELFEKWMADNVDDCDDIGSETLFQCWQAARARGGQPENPAAWVSRDLLNGECVGSMAYREKNGNDQVPVYASAQSGQGVEARGFDFDGWYDKHESLFREGAGKSDLRAAYRQGYRDSQPQPAVPEGWRVIRMPELQKALMTGPIIGLDGPRGESVPVVSDSDDRRERHLYQFLGALLSTPTTPQPASPSVPVSVITPEIVDWVKCGIAANNRHKEKEAVDAFHRFNDAVLKASEAMNNDASPTPQADGCKQAVILTVCYQEGCSEWEPIYFSPDASDEVIEATVYEDLYHEIHSNPGFRSYSWKRVESPQPAKEGE